MPPTTVTETQLLSAGWVRQSPATDAVQKWSIREGTPPASGPDGRRVTIIYWDSTSGRWFTFDPEPQNILRTLLAVALVLEYVIDQSSLAAGVKAALKQTINNTLKER